MTIRLEARALRVELGARTVLDGVDCAVEPGRLLAILGPNGAGKTTLVKALAGLIPARAGAVSIGVRALAGLPARERARAIAYLPQSGAVSWPLPVRAVVALGRLPHGGTPDTLSAVDRDAVARALAATDLGGFEDRIVTTLSGGERARVLLARALAVDAPVLLCDEPVAALDPRHQLAVMTGLKAQAAAGRAVAVVMHDLALAARYADRVLILVGGRVMADGSPRDVLTPERVAAAFGVEALFEERADGLLVVPWRVVP